MSLTLSRRARDKAVAEEALLDDLMSQLFSDRGQMSVKSHNATRDRLRKLERSSEGKLSHREFRLELAQMGVKWRFKQDEQLLKVLDPCGNGTVSAKSLMERLEQRNNTKLRQRLQVASYSYGVDLAKLFRHYGDKTNAIGWDEFLRCVRKDCKLRPALMSDEELRELFEAVDVTCDGCIDEEEFIALLTGCEVAPRPAADTYVRGKHISPLKQEALEAGPDRKQTEFEAALREVAARPEPSARRGAAQKRVVSHRASGRVLSRAFFAASQGQSTLSRDGLTTFLSRACGAQFTVVSAPIPYPSLIPAGTRAM